MKNIFKEYEDWELRTMWRKSNKLEDKRYLANFGFSSDVHDLMHDPRWSQDKRIKEAIIIKHGMYLDTFVHDPDEDIRVAVASKGRDEDLKILVHDPSVKVRKEVAVESDQAFNPFYLLDILLNDESSKIRVIAAEKYAQYGEKYFDKLIQNSVPDVRAVVAKIVPYYGGPKGNKIKNKYLDILVKDKDDRVRAKVARWSRRAKDLNELAQDQSFLVRQEVALRGRDRNLAKLVDDPDKDVRKAAAEKVREKDLENLQEMQKNGKISQTTDLEIIADLLPEWRKSDKPKDKAFLVRYGRTYDLSELTKARSLWRENEIVMKAIAEHDDEKERK